MVTATGVGFDVDLDDEDDIDTLIVFGRTWQWTPSPRSSAT